MKFRASAKDCIRAGLLKHVYLCTQSLSHRSTCTCAKCTLLVWTCTLYSMYAHIPVYIGLQTACTNTQKKLHVLHVPIVYTVLVNNSGVEESRRLLCGLVLRQQVTLQPAAARTWWLSSPLLNKDIYLSLFNSLSQWSKRRHTKCFLGQMPKVYWTGLVPTTSSPEKSSMVIPTG